MDKIKNLDLEIMIKNGKLETNLFVKPSNLQIYFDFMSNHPTHCKVGLIYRQALITIERCSNPSDANLHQENVKGKLLARNYPVKVIQKQFTRAKQMIQQNRTKKKSDAFSHTMRVIPLFIFGSEKPKNAWSKMTKQRKLVKHYK